MAVWLGMDEPVWLSTTSAKNRERAGADGVTEVFQSATAQEVDTRSLLSHELVAVDDTLLEARVVHPEGQRGHAGGGAHARRAGDALPHRRDVRAAVAPVGWVFVDESGVATDLVDAIAAADAVGFFCHCSYVR